MRQLGLAVVLAATPFLAIAAPDVSMEDGSPAIQGDGTSSTTVEVIGGTAAVTVESTGSIGVFTHSGTVEGAGTVGVPQLGVEVGGGYSNSSGEAGRGTGGNGGSGGTAGVNSGSNASNGTRGNGVAANSVAVANASDGDQPVCELVTPGKSASVLDLALLTDSGKISVSAVCGTNERASDRVLAALEKNDVLVRAVQSADYSTADIFYVEMGDDGAAVIYVPLRS